MGWRPWGERSITVCLSKLVVRHGGLLRFGSTRLQHSAPYGCGHNEREEDEVVPNRGHLPIGNLEPDASYQLDDRETHTVFTGDSFRMAAHTNPAPIEITTL